MTGDGLCDARNSGILTDCQCIPLQACHHYAGYQTCLSSVFRTIFQGLSFNLTSNLPMRDMLFRFPYIFERNLLIRKHG